MKFMGNQFSKEESYLYNPAYIGALLYQAVREYQNNKQLGMHCGLVYLVIPLSVSKPYQEILPKNISPSISSWAKQFEGELSALPRAVNAYADIVNSAIAFLLHKKLLSLDDSGFFSCEETSLIAKKPSYISNDITFYDSYLSSGLLGRWFSQATTAESVYAQLGIQP